MKILLLCALVFCGVNAQSQDVNVLMKQANNYERALKEDSALLKYKEVLATNPNNLQALVKSSLLISAAGARQTNKAVQKEDYEAAKMFGDKALVADSNSVDAMYAKGLSILKMSQVEQENKKKAALIKEAHSYAAKALIITPTHGKSNFLLGKWNFDLVTTAWTKKAAVSVLYGGMPDASIENALLYMENCRGAEPYFVENFLELAKAYKFNNNPSKAIEVLTQLVKLPNRTADDKAWKDEGKKMLNEMK